MMEFLSDISALDGLGEPAQSIVRLLVAAVLGSIIGIEREHHGRSAGFRTLLLVGIGSALAMVVSLHFATVFGNTPQQAIKVDPARVAYGVMMGVGFLGAGAIIRFGASIRGMTTAASIWCTSAVGLACGFGMFYVAGAATAVILFALLVLSRLEQHLPSKWYKAVRVTLPPAEGNVPHLRELLIQYGADVLDMDYRRSFRDQSETITFHVAMSRRAKPSDLLRLRDDVPQMQSMSIH
jgi:putative Mg2+ transporter-C (MgtC) family protein